MIKEIQLKRINKLLKMKNLKIRIKLNLTNLMIN